ncbi:MAG: hypothetical protein Q8K42_09805 [Methylobacter sp.]|nr:hypothetical protein [Methylobacter sp.]
MGSWSSVSPGKKLFKGRLANSSRIRITLQNRRSIGACLIEGDVLRRIRVGKTSSTTGRSANRA